MLLKSIIQFICTVNKIKDKFKTFDLSFYQLVSFCSWDGQSIWYIQLKGYDLKSHWELILYFLFFFALFHSCRLMASLNCNKINKKKEQQKTIVLIYQDCFFFLNSLDEISLEKKSYMPQNSLSIIRNKYSMVFNSYLLAYFNVNFLKYSRHLLFATLYW